ncbi:HAMP domain-containing sensor histidine kinase [Chishuiella changwenlii]|uniref:sensor histidine kinase n=1 Tax=Chishuiella changwenlii TaxID=1434701 RepID=UPI002FDB5752
MKLPKKYYSSLFAIVLLILVALQAYYIYNSYRLIERDLILSSREIATKVMNDMDEKNDINNDKLLAYFKRLNHEKDKQISELQVIQNKANFTNSQYREIVDSLINFYNAQHSFEIAIRSEVYSVYDEINKKELIIPNQSFIFYESKRKIIHPMNINESVWSTDDLNTEKDDKLGIEKSERHKYKIKAKIDFELLNLKFLLIKKITPLILISLLIVGLIVYLYWKSLKNLTKQEEKNNQLHLTIDSIAHELNTPITTLKFASQNIQDLETKQVIKRQINRLENTIETILIKDNKNDVLLDEISMTKVIDDLKNQYATITILSTINFEYNHLLSQYDFEQIVKNMIENSVKYGATNCYLNFDFNRKIKLTFTDDGIGIPVKDIPHVFDKYYRVDRTINQHINGLGVGLYIIKTIVDSYNGKIILQNNAEKGVEFKIVLPNEN